MAAAWAHLGRYGFDYAGELARHVTTDGTFLSDVASLDAVMAALSEEQQRQVELGHLGAVKDSALRNVLYRMATTKYRTVAPPDEQLSPTMSQAQREGFLAGGQLAFDTANKGYHNPAMERATSALSTRRAERAAATPVSDMSIPGAGKPRAYANPAMAAVQDRQLKELRERRAALAQAEAKNAQERLDRWSKLQDKIDARTANRVTQDNARAVAFYTTGDPDAAPSASTASSQSAHGHDTTVGGPTSLDPRTGPKTTLVETDRIAKAAWRQRRETRRNADLNLLMTERRWLDAGQAARKDQIDTLNRELRRRGLIGRDDSVVPSNGRLTVPGKAGGFSRWFNEAIGMGSTYAGYVDGVRVDYAERDANYQAPAGGGRGGSSSGSDGATSGKTPSRKSPADRMRDKMDRGMTRQAAERSVWGD